MVTDRGLGAGAMVAAAMSALRAAGLDAALFSDLASDPTGEDVARGGEALRAHRGDGVIAFGGGSSLDAGKAISAWDFTKCMMRKAMSSTAAVTPAKSFRRRPVPAE